MHYFIWWHEVNFLTVVHSCEKLFNSCYLVGASIPWCSSLTPNLIPLNLKGKVNANPDIIQPDDFTASTARREHVRFCSNISWKESTNSFTRGGRDEQFFYKLFRLRQVYPSISVFLPQIEAQIVLRCWLTNTRQIAKRKTESLKNFKVARCLWACCVCLKVMSYL